MFFWGIKDLPTTTRCWSHQDSTLTTFSPLLSQVQLAEALGSHGPHVPVLSLSKEPLTCPERNPYPVSRQLELLLSILLGTIWGMWGPRASSASCRWSSMEQDCLAQSHLGLHWCHCTGQ